MAENRCNEMSSSSTSSSPMIDSSRSYNKSSLNAPKNGTPVPNRVFVGGIPTEVSENEVKLLFAQYGNVVSVKIINDRAGVPRGYGFVTFESEEDAKRVIKESENLIIKNRKLNVSEAVKKQPPFGYELNPHLVPNGAFVCNPFPLNATNYLCPDIGLYSAEGIPLYQLGVSPQFAANGSITSTAYPYTTYPSSGLYLATQPSLSSMAPQFQSVNHSPYQYGCGSIRLPLTSQNNMTPNMNVNPFVQLSSATSPPLSQPSVAISSPMPVQVANAVNPNTECANGITGAANSAMSQYNFIHPIYAISSNMPLSNSTQMACVQNVHLKADNLELCSDNNSLMPATAISPQMVEIVWPQRVPNIDSPNKVALNRYSYSPKSHNNANATNAPLIKDRRNNSSFNASQKKLGNNYGNNRPKGSNNYSSQNRNFYVSATDNDIQIGHNHESHQSSTPNSSAFQGQPFVKQYPPKYPTLPFNQAVVNNSQQPLGPKHTISGQTFVPKVVNGVQIYALANLSGGDCDNFGSPLTPPLTPATHTAVHKAIHKA